MSNNHLKNSEGSMSRTAQSQFPTTSSIYQHPPQPHIHNTPISPVRMPDNPLRSPERMQTISALQLTPPQTPQPTRVAPPPAPFPSLKTGYLEIMAPPSVQVEQEEKQDDQDQMTEETETETDKIIVNELGPEVYHQLKTFGQVLGIVASSQKHTREKTMAEKEALNSQVKELQEKNELLKGKVAETLKKSAGDIQQVKSEVATWRTQCMELNDRAKEVKKEHEKKIESLKKTVADKDEKIEDLQVSVYQHELSESQLKKELEEKDKEIDSLKKKASENEKQIIDDKVEVANLLESEKELIKKVINQKKEIEESSKQLSKANENFIRVRTENKELERKNGRFLRTERANQIYIDNLKTEKINLESTAEKMKAAILEKSNEISKISQELEKEKRENEAKGVDLEKKTKRIEDLKVKVKVLQKEQDEIRENFHTAMSQVEVSIFPNRKRSLSGSSSSSENATSPETLPKSMAVVDKGQGNERSRISSASEADPRKSQEHFPRTRAIGSIKYPIRKRSKTGGDVEIPEVSSSSRTSISPSSSSGRQYRHYRNRSESKQ